MSRTDERLVTSSSSSSRASSPRPSCHSTPAYVLNTSRVRKSMSPYCWRVSSCSSVTTVSADSHFSSSISCAHRADISASDVLSLDEPPSTVSCEESPELPASFFGEIISASVSSASSVSEAQSTSPWAATMVCLFRQGKVTLGSQHKSVRARCNGPVAVSPGFGRLQTAPKLPTTETHQDRKAQYHSKCSKWLRTDSKGVLHNE